MFAKETMHMKKKLLVLFAIVAVLAMLAVPAFADSKKITIPYKSNDEVKIDAAIDEKYTANGGRLYNDPEAPWTVLDGVEFDGVTYNKDDDLFNVNGGSFFFANSDHLYILVNLTKITKVTDKSYIRILINRTDDPDKVTTIKIPLIGGKTNFEFTPDEYFFGAEVDNKYTENRVNVKNPNGTALFEMALTTSPEHRFHAGDTFSYQLYVVNASDEDHVEASTLGDVTDRRFVIGDLGENDVPDFDVSACGSGTSDDPYLIGNVQTLEFFRDCINYNLKGAHSAHYRLTADIDYKDAQWTSIGTTAVPFNGIFDGGGFAVQNLTQRKAQDKVYNGFFAVIGTEGVVKNLRIEHIVIDTQKYDGTMGMVGGIAGLSKGTISDSFVDDARFRVFRAAHQMAVGGIVGYGDGTITKCYFTNTFTTDNDVSKFNVVQTDYALAIAGICGDPTAKISECSVRNTNFVYVRLVEDGYFGFIGAKEGAADCTIVKSVYSNCKNRDVGPLSGKVPPDTQPVTNPPETTPAPETTDPNNNNNNPGTSDMFAVIAIAGALAAAAAIVISRKKQFNR